MQTSSLKIKQVEKPDVKKLQDICLRTFSETYEHLNTPENFKKYVETNFNKARLSKELSDNNSFTYFLFLDNAIIGYLKLNIAGSQTEQVEGNSLEIERIYVLKDHHGKKLGKYLITFSLEKAASLKKEFVWLGVWEKNEKAISFYEKNGFKKFDKHTFILGNDAQTDYLYKRML
ncbi:MAG: GNAT family N-acetyltransferase [Bacteroidia bacterium]